MRTARWRAGAPLSPLTSPTLQKEPGQGQTVNGTVNVQPPLGPWRSGLRSQAALLGIGLAWLLIVLSLGAPLLAPYDPVTVDLDAGMQRPSWQHWLGTDQLGRDVWSRLLWAGRTSVGLATVIAVLTLTVGMGLGLLAGYGGGLLDDLAMRLTDFVSALPPIILTLACIGTLGPSLLTMVLALALTGWTPYARLARSLVLRMRTQEWVLAVYALGARPRRILFRHVLPAALGPVAVQVSLNVGGTILTVAGLSFLGLGVQPPTPEWGAMLVEARPFLASAPHLVLPPGLAIFLVVFGFTALAERLTGQPQA